MKILPPTLRESNRYIACSLTCEENISRRDLINEILFSAATLFGDTGNSELGLRLLAFENNKGIIKCLANRVWESRTVLACVSSVRGIRVRIQILGISGTVQAVTEKYLLAQSIGKAEQARKRAEKIKECKIVIAERTISGCVVDKKNDEIDLLSEDSQYNEILNRSNTRYFGITVFDVR